MFVVNDALRQLLCSWAEIAIQKEEPGSHVRAGFDCLVTVAYEEVAVSHPPANQPAAPLWLRL